MKRAQAKLEIYSQEVEKEKTNLSKVFCSSTEESEFSQVNMEKQQGTRRNVHHETTKMSVKSCTYYAKFIFTCCLNINVC